MRYAMGKPAIGPAEAAAVMDCLRSGQITQGKRVAAFEDAFARRVGCEHAVACSSGTAALHLAFAALGIGKGDEVLVPDLTYVATANAVAYTGASPVLCDVEADGWCIDLADAGKKLGPRVVAIAPVHLYGRPCEMARVMRFAAEHGLWVVEDAAEALGGSHAGKALGTFGHLGAFSFYGNKAITTGEGGMVTTDDEALAIRCRLLRGQGQGERRFMHEALGWNYRMTDLAASLGLAQLTKLDAFLQARAAVVSEYRDALSGLLEWPEPPAGQAPWMFTALVPRGANRDAFMAAMAHVGVETRPAFPPMHEQPMYRRPAADFPVSSEVASRGVSLPTHACMSRSDARDVADLAGSALVGAFRA